MLDDLAKAFILIWLGAVLAVTYLFYLKDRAMQNKECFDLNQPDHLMSLARLLDEILNEEHGDIRFALLVWQDHRDDIQGLISNSKSDKIVIGMLDDAKSKISRASVVHPTPGHA